MPQKKTKCATCGCEIRQVTADRRGGMCVPCYRSRSKPPEEIFAEQVFERTCSVVEPFKNYREALQNLQQLPLGHSFCFAFHHVHEDILNGGISQFYRNSTWALILRAEEAARVAGFTALAKLFREIVYYYHAKGRSKHKRNLPENYFDLLPAQWDKSLRQLEGEFFAIERDANSVILTLCRDHQNLFSNEQA